MHPCAHICTCVCVCLSACGCLPDQAWSLKISDCFLRLFFSVWLCVGCVSVNVWGNGSLWLSITCVCVCVCACLFAFRVCSRPVPSSCPRLLLSAGSTLSAQSVPTMYPGQLALLAPGGLADSNSSTLLQPLKPSPSSDNLCSAYTSEAALSVPSLCAPTPGRHPPRVPGPHYVSAAFRVHTNSLLYALHAD